MYKEFKIKIKEDDLREIKQHLKEGDCETEDDVDVIRELFYLEGGYRCRELDMRNEVEISK